MTSKEKLHKFLDLQNKEVKIEEIAKELNSTVKSIRAFMNRQGYKSVNGKYVSKETNDEKTVSQPQQISMEVITKPVAPKKKSTSTKKKQSQRVNVTVDDMDKLCEVYDWYLSVKDCKSIKPRKNSKIKDVNIESISTDLKSTTVKVDKNTWDEFERLCSNSTHNKKDILTQALKDFMKEYKNLL